MFHHLTSLAFAVQQIRIHAVHEVLFSRARRLLRQDQVEHDRASLELYDRKDQHAESIGDVESGTSR